MILYYNLFYIFMNKYYYYFYNRESSSMFQQCERIRNVINLMIESSKHSTNNHKLFNGTTNSQSDYLRSSLDPLKKTIIELENSFETSRGLAVTLDTKLESCRNVMYSDIINSVEPYIDLADEVYSSFDYNLLNSINDTISAINKSIRYRPGETKLQQETIVDGLGGTYSSEYLYNLINQSYALISYLKEFNEVALIKCPGIEILSNEIETKSIDEIMEDCFLLHKGNYASICDIVSTTFIVKDLEMLREFLGILATNDGEKKRVNLPGI